MEEVEEVERSPPGAEQDGEVSEAERRRQERRRKILQNQESRLKKILGSNTSSKDIERMTGNEIGDPLEVDLDTLPSTSSSTSPVTLTTSEPNQISKTRRSDESESSKYNEQGLLLEKTILQQSQPQPNITATWHSSNNGSRYGTATATAEPAQAQAQLPVWLHRTILCIFGATLPFLDLSYFLMYFLAWEFAVWKVFGGLRAEPTPPNLFITLILVMGLTEQQIVKFKQLIRIVSVLWADICIFIMSTALTQIAFSVFRPVQYEQDVSAYIR